MLQRVNSMKGFHSFYQRFIAFCLIDQVHAGLIQRDRITACQYTDIVDIGFRRMSVAVAVHGDPVHHIDVNNVLLPHMAAEPGHHLRQSFQPGVLIAVPDTAARLRTGSMDIHFPARGGDTDADILDCTAKACHRMSLEVREDHPVTVILCMASDDHLVDPRSAGHGPLHFAFLIHQIKIGDRRVSVIFRDLPVHGRA